MFNETVPQFTKMLSNLSGILFHITTAYSILRHNGVDVGKMDFLGSLELKDC